MTKKGWGASRELLIYLKYVLCNYSRGLPPLLISNSRKISVRGRRWGRGSAEKVDFWVAIYITSLYIKRNL